MDHKWRRRGPGLQPWPYLAKLFLLTWLCALGTLYQLDNRIKGLGQPLGTGQKQWAAVPLWPPKLSPGLGALSQGIQLGWSRQHLPGRTEKWKFSWPRPCSLLSQLIVSLCPGSCCVWKLPGLRRAVHPWGLKARAGYGRGCRTADAGTGIHPFLAFPLYHPTSCSPTTPSQEH